MKNKALFGLVVAIIVQGLVLIGMVASSALPLWTGTQIKIKTIPVDPRSMFRGNYARLGYAFSRIDRSKVAGLEGLRSGSVVYILLKPGADGIHTFDQMVKEKPGDGIFVRGRVQNNHGWIDLKCGIEAFFAPKEKALKLEDDLRDGGLAVLMVAGNGRARLKDVIGTQ